MRFQDTYISGQFLSKLYEALRDSRSLIRSDLYGLPSEVLKEDFQGDIFVLLLELEDLSNYLK